MSRFSSDHFEESFKSFNLNEKHEFIDNFLKICEPHDLFYLCSKLEQKELEDEKSNIDKLKHSNGKKYLELQVDQYILQLVTGKSFTE